MTARHALALVLLGLCAHGGLAGAQEVIRCGNSYGQQPCADGSAVQAADPRSPAQRAQASANIRRDTQLAKEIEEARLKEEAQAEASRVRASQPAAETARAAASKPKRPPVFKATGPKSSNDAARKSKSKAANKKKPVTAPRAG